MYIIMSPDGSHRWSPIIEGSEEGKGGRDWLNYPPLIHLVGFEPQHLQFAYHLKCEIACLVTIEC